MKEADIIRRLKEVARFFELYHKTSFEGYRRTKNGTSQEVIVDILDAGPEGDEVCKL